jgi:hypothetical protein
MRPILIILFFMLVCVSAKSQGWQSGSFIDTKGNQETGLIRRTNRQPVKDEAAIEFRNDKNNQHFTISASDLKSVVIGRDSFVVAEAPQTSDWKNYLDFVKVVFDEDDEMKIYAFQGYSERGGGGKIIPEFGVGVGGGVGTGGGGFGAGVGGGVAIPIGGGGGRGNSYQSIYYYGDNTAHMRVLTSANFVDIMSQIMGDEADIVDALQQNKYNIGNINKLIYDYKKEQK